MRVVVAGSVLIMNIATQQALLNFSEVLHAPQCRQKSFSSNTWIIILQWNLFIGTSFYNAPQNQI